MVNTQATTTVAQWYCPHTFIGVTLASHESPGGVLYVQLMGIRMAHPSTARTRNMSRHMRANLMKRAASMPTRFTKSCSVVFHRGLTHAKMPFPSGGGACFSSACLTLGAYTTLLKGRTKEKPRAMAAVMPREEPNAANTASLASWRGANS